MKHIKKSKTPAELTQWLRKQKGHDCTYETHLPGEVKQALHTRLLQEQGKLCGYTGIRIGYENSHIEHIYPQSECRKEAVDKRLFGAKRDVDYRNVIAAFPKSDTAWRDRYPFGAKTRGDWYDTDLFVHPLRPDCEKRFRYTLQGVIEPADGDPDGAAGTTIRKLNLDDRRRDENGTILDNGPLTELRRAAIEALLFDEGKPISKAQLERVLADIYKRDSEGNLTEFCFVLKQACEQLLAKARREHKKRLAINKQAQQPPKRPT